LRAFIGRCNFLRIYCALEINILYFTLLSKEINKGFPESLVSCVVGCA
jgi:hypothetical protein